MSEPHDATEAFQRLLEALGTSASMAGLDLAAKPTGEHWLDLQVDVMATNVAFRAEHGYGLYVTDEDAFGAHPEEVVREPEKSAARLREIAASWKVTVPGPDAVGGSHG